MANRRTAIQLSAEEQREFLATARTLQIATIGPSGQPHLVPMWFGVDDDGRIIFTTYGSAQKIKNLERDPRITVLIEDGTVYDQLRGMMIEGEAEIIRDDPEVTRMAMRAVGEKYGTTRREDGAQPEGQQALPDRTRAIGKRVVVRIKPKRVVSWDHSRLLAK